MTPVSLISAAVPPAAAAASLIDFASPAISSCTHSLSHQPPSRRPGRRERNVAKGSDLEYFRGHDQSSRLFLNQIGLFY